MSKIFIVLFLVFSFFITKSAFSLETCSWSNINGTPCLTIRKTPNTSKFNEKNINKTTINKQDIIESGAIDIKDVFDLVNGLDTFQSGQKGQQTSIFTRGSESNHTLVLLNGIAINDQSTTDGLHDFGQDFVQTIQQIEIYKGSNGAHFGPNAIGGAINIITDIDYNNNFTIGGFNKKNNSLSLNYTNIEKQNHHLNTKFAFNQSKTNSAIAKGVEKDGSTNFQTNINSTYWFDEKLKMKNILYARNTDANYDGSATDEFGYNSNNTMYAVQNNLNFRSENSENDLKFHYHKYDREYENGGFLDEYYSKSITLKGEHKKSFFDKISYGVGSEYKYDDGEFENRGSYSASTKGNMNNFGAYGNIGYNLNEFNNLSFHYRMDKHKMTKLNDTYKINYTKIFNNLKFSFSHSTGLRNPSLYEFFGTDSTGYIGNKNLNPEKSSTNEIYNEINFNDKLKIKLTAYKTNIHDRIELNSGWTSYENKTSDLNQEGLENEILYIKDNHKFSVFSHFAKSRTDTNGPQSRRPDLSYSLRYSNKKINSNSFGNLGLNINYKYTGEYIDWDGSKNSFQKSTNLLDLNLFKSDKNKVYSIKLSNILNERYEKPATYSQNGRDIYLNIITSF